MFNNENTKGNHDKNSKNGKNLSEDKKLLKSLIERINEERSLFFPQSKLNKISKGDLVDQIVMLMKEEFLGNIEIRGKDKISVAFNSGERFSIRVKKLEKAEG